MQLKLIRSPSLYLPLFEPYDSTEKIYSEVTYTAFFEFLLSLLLLVELLHLVTLLSNKLLLDSTSFPVVKLRKVTVRKIALMEPSKNVFNGEDSFVLLGALLLSPVPN